MSHGGDFKRLIDTVDVFYLISSGTNSLKSVGPSLKTKEAGLSLSQPLYINYGAEAGTESKKVT